ncbi:MAG TPA: DNA alkylation repair protein [Opitutae bacterium]|nr:DNA alkylation repair protein [Puniceicoccaceae bacterium]HBR94438.1 DNA alkylation repair protein [Opitutae bacterium]|tara:strand:- start:2853 stop:3695 length:843 start_codon:yes stop_codon:yes gene_type:complete
MHPSEKFIAPNTILTGVPLKQLIDAKLVALIAESFAAVDARFDAKAFVQMASQGLEALELKDRARHIAHALQAQLPKDVEQACDCVIRAMGPKLEVTQDYGLAPFFYMPQSEWIGRYAIADFASGMRANYELTQRYTAEFSIRPFVIEHEAACLRMLNTWCQDPNPHVRRLVSEGTRSRLPWAVRLKNIQVKPALSLPLLEQLKDDPELYVRRSVANHLGDIAKDHLELVLTTCNRWLEESHAMEDPQAAKKRRWIIRHALRYPAKKGNQSALNIRLAAK